jgi:hypothetical protein
VREWDRERFRGEKGREREEEGERKEIYGGKRRGTDKERGRRREGEGHRGRRR